MKKLLFACLVLCSFYASAQTGVVSSAEVDNVLRGIYTPSTYFATTPITDPTTISSEIVSRISTDTLKAYLFKLRSFQNRNAASTTASPTIGIGATRTWVLSKFNEFSALNENRLRPSNMTFSVANGVVCSALNHTNVIAVLPGTQNTDKSVLLIEAHMDSRNDVLCDISGSALGIEDNATGTALVLELARVMSKYSFRNTIVFAITTAEEQGKIGAVAMANYFNSKGIKIRAVSNNDVSGGTFCGHTSSAPSCPGFGNIDSVGLRIFSLNTFNSPHKQWARYVKLQYKQRAAAFEPVPTQVRIMTPEDRTGRGGDHQPFSAIGYTAVRFTAANENGDASNGMGYVDRQHNIRDSLGKDLNSDGIEDTIFVSVNYLRRNAIVNGVGLANAALAADTATLKANLIGSTNKMRVQFTAPVTPMAGYRVAVRSATNDWDTVFTMTGKTVDTVTVPYGISTTFFVSGAGMDALGTETLFSTEYSLTTANVLLALQPLTNGRVAYERLYGITLLQNKPNPFDVGTAHYH